MAIAVLLRDSSRFCAVTIISVISSELLLAELVVFVVCATCPKAGAIRKIYPTDASKHRSKRPPRIPEKTTLSAPMPESSDIPFPLFLNISTSSPDFSQPSREHSHMGDVDPSHGTDTAFSGLRLSAAKANSLAAPSPALCRAVQCGNELDELPLLTT
jgi:hypothetical protein